MLRRIRVLRDRLLGTLWFIPAAIVAASLVLAAGMVELSAHVDDEALAHFPRVFGASAGSSRSILSAVASGMITVAGLTFSLTMVAVTQASSQYTPRILRNFMGDRANQLVLGTFVGIFAYCLVVLRTIRSADEGLTFVPSLAVVLGIVLAIVGIGVLIYFVHHIASTLQASSIVARVAQDTVRAVDALFPTSLGGEADHDEAAATRHAAAVSTWHAVPAPATGYVQSIDEEALLTLAGRAERLIRMERGVGEFVVAGLPLASVAADEGPGGLRNGAAARRVPTPGADDDRARSALPPEELAERVARMYAIGQYRTVDQDAAFGIRQLVDVALKALSPGVNDTTTAVSCIDYLGAVLVHLSERRIESPVREHHGTVRVLARGPSFESLLRLALDEIRQNAGANVSVLRRLLQTIAQVAAVTRDDRRVALLAAHAALVHETAERTVEAVHDRAHLRECFDAFAAASSIREPAAAGSRAGPAIARADA